MSTKYQSRPAWRNQWLAIALAIALVLVCAVLGNEFYGAEAAPAAGEYLLLGASAAAALVLFVVILYRHYSWAYTVDEDVIESRRGIIGRDVKSTRIRDLRNINVQQSFFERIFGIGNVEFSSAGGAGIEVSFEGITRPLEVKRFVQDRQNALAGETPVD